MSILWLQNKPVCIDCTLSYMQENISRLKSKKRWAIVKSIVLLIIIFIAVAVWQVQPNEPNVIITAWIIAAIGGIFSSAKLAKQSEREQAVNDLYTKLNPEDGLIHEGMGCVLSILTAVLFAPFYTIGHTLKNLFRWISSSNSLRKAEREYREYTAILSERGEL